MDRETKIQRALRDLRTAFAESLHGLECNVAAETGRVSKEIEKRKEFARSIVLSARIFSTYGDIKYYPEWSQNSQANYVCPSISDVAVFEESGKSRYGHEESVDFEFRGNRWSFAFRGNHVILPDGADGGYYGRLSLLDSAKNLVFEGRYQRGEYSYTYEPLDIEAFVPGEWTVEFLELSEEIAAIRRESELKRERSELEEQKQRFGLIRDDNYIETITRQVSQYVAQPNPSKAKEKGQGLVATFSVRYFSWIKNKLSAR
jgi:hypothetical protein